MRQLTPEQIGIDYRALLELIGEERAIDLIGEERLLELLGEERVRAWLELQHQKPKSIGEATASKPKE